MLQIKDLEQDCVVTPTGSPTGSGQVGQVPWPPMFL
jgi:hypothetical protein